MMITIDNYNKSGVNGLFNYLALLSEMMPEIVSAADVIVVPQRNTPAAQAQFPLKLTDGMAMAKPILATQGRRHTTNFS